MRDAEANVQIARVAALRKKWHTILGLNRWTVTDQYERGCIPSYPGAQACTQTQWEYNRATVTWDLTQLGQQDDDELEWVFLHEAMHILVAQMRDCHSEDDANKHEEQVATNLAYVLQWVYAAGRKAGKKGRK